jgi:hypothetical protein
MGIADVGPERRRLLEPVLEVHEDRVLPERRHIRHDVGHRHHERRVLQQDTGVAVIGVVIVRARREHEVGLPLADLPDDLLPDLERRQQLAVVVVEDDVVDADAAAGFDGLGAARIASWPPPCS